jgi:GNAT superfamily N-acetyltransferase
MLQIPEIRQAAPDDAAAIARAYVDSWRTTYAQILPHAYLARISCDERANAWARQLANPESKEFIYVADHPAKGIVGFASGGPERTGMSDYSGELCAIYLVKAAQRGGIGRRLVSAVACRLAESGHASMMVWVLADNPSRRFYEKLGGVPIAEKLIVLGGKELVEVAYGWNDVHALIEN